jgi:hypothetical protein
MFSRKNTIIVAFMAIFVLCIAILHADLMDVEVSNVYSYGWSNQAVIVEIRDWANQTWTILNSGPMFEQPITYTFHDVYIIPGGYHYYAHQGDREVSGPFSYHGQWGISIRLPGPYEPRPDDPPVQD